MKKVLMIGMYGVYNYGCEAIARGCVEILKKKYPEGVDVYYASPNPKDDELRLSGCEIHLIQRDFQTKNLSNVIRKLSELFGKEYPALIENIDVFKGFDAVYSIGGDIYTVDKDGNAPLSFMNYANKCMDMNIPYYMLCSSIGPFNNNKWLSSFIIPHLKRIKKIYAREQNTIDYLNKIGISENVCLLTDPAFFVPSPKKVDYKDKVIGINLSPLSSLHFYDDYEKSLEADINSIKSILNRTSYDILLIPHVKSKDKNDDDFEYLSKIHCVLNNLYPERVRLVADDIGFLGRKSQLIDCDYVISSRMHCAINAICCGVPTLFLSYSEKSKGMSKFIYGSDKWAVDLTDFKNTSLILELLSKLPIVDDKINSITDINFIGDDVELMKRND